MFQLNVVDRGGVLDHMGSGNLCDPKRGYRYFFRLVLIAGRPFFLAIDMLEDAFCQANGRAAWRILFFGMVDLIQADIIGGKGIHDPGEVFIDLEEDINAKAEVRCVKKGTVVVGAYFFNFSLPRKPSCGTANDRDTPFEASFHIVEGRFGMAVRCGHIGTRTSKYAHIVTYIHFGHRNSSTLCS